MSEQGDPVVRGENWAVYVERSAPHAYADGRTVLLSVVEGTGSDSEIPTWLTPDQASAVAAALQRQADGGGPNDST